MKIIVLTLRASDYVKQAGSVCQDVFSPLLWGEPAQGGLDWTNIFGRKSLFSKWLPQ